ncbi:hypothetical protein ABZV77_05870 [Streptomyces sp. NPDC004732]|uniref:hypothetical protein n=1 Tax=Streptomyces sp. NPDC004732 TaxID=3154290 RepID=UPI0033A8BA13
MTPDQFVAQHGENLDKALQSLKVDLIRKRDAAEDAGSTEGVRVLTAEIERADELQTDLDKARRAAPVK